MAHDLDDQELHQELVDLVRGFRRQLAWVERRGTVAAPAGPTTRPPMPEVVGAVQPDSTVNDSADAGVAPTGGGRTLAMVRDELGDCQRCKLASTRTNIVFGVGSERADLMFIGEAPGADEDRTGEPFVGRAGQLLDRMIEAMGYRRDEVYIANVLKCRPPDNRDPQVDEVASCEPFLHSQIAAIRPRIIVTLGKPAAQLVLKTDAPISSLRGRFHSYRGVKVMPTFHPAFLLRQPESKRETWNDLQQVMAELDRLGLRAAKPPQR